MTMLLDVDLFSAAGNLISAAQEHLYLDVFQPLIYKFGLMSYGEELYDGLYWMLVGLIQLALSYAMLRPLEALIPLERWPDRRQVWSDVIYTWIARLGILELVFFFALQPAFNQLQSWMSQFGLDGLELEYLWPQLTNQPLLEFMVYLVVLDFAGYWYHRWQHKFRAWWELHAVHHSQQQMSFWCDNRNHFIDDILQAMFFAGVALLIGVGPSQFVALVAVSNFLQSVQHVNARIRLGVVLSRVVVSPAFHRRHHAVGYGHEGTRYGCNFGVLFPWWDMLFGTASWNEHYEPTGIRDQLPAPLGTGRSYGRGVLAQQWNGIKAVASVLIR